MLTISAVIPVYNRAEILPEAIDSAMSQTKPPDEIIVIDDGSTDHTKDIIDKYSGRVKYIRQANSGPASARNRGIQAASGDFIAFLDSDDLWTEDRISSQISALERFPHLDVIFGREAFFTEKGQFECRTIHDPGVSKYLAGVECVLPEPLPFLFKENFIPTSTALFRKSCIAKVGLIDEELRQAEDYDFWLRFGVNGFRFGFVDSILCHRRKHEGNLVNHWLDRTLATVTVLSRYRTCELIWRKSLVRRLSDLYYDAGSYLLYKGRFRAALYHLQQAGPIGHGRLAWAAKITIARILCSIIPYERYLSVGVYPDPSHDQPRPS